VKGKKPWEGMVMREGRKERGGTMGRKELKRKYGRGKTGVVGRNGKIVGRWGKARESGIPKGTKGEEWEKYGWGKVWWAKRKMKEEVRKGKKGKCCETGRTENGRRLKGNGKNRKWEVAKGKREK
jgi:hypothetical protein